MEVLQKQQSTTSWQMVVAEKLKRDEKKLQADWKLSPKILSQARDRKSIANGFIDGLLDDRTKYLTSLDTVDLMKRTGEGSLSALELTMAFCKRAAFTHQLNKNLIEIGFEKAMQRAKTLDDFWAMHRRPIGPLHGLPITMKDQFHVKGMGTTMGYVGWIDTFEGDKASDLKHRAESELVRKLESLGAIVIAKTTLVQSLWYGETNNNILGYHWNPINQKLSSGGSSGGEGAIQALRGSAVGFATDIGGSVSMPAACNGVFSIKPSAGRLPTMDMPNSSLGQINMPTVVGMLGPSVTTLRYVFEALVSSEPWLTDPSVLPIPWRQPKRYSKLSFGFMDFDGVVVPHPPILRALRMTREALQAAGHEIIPWEGPSLQEAAAIHPSITMADGNSDVFTRLSLSGEHMIPQLVPYAPTGKSQPPKTAIEVAQSVQTMLRYRARHLAYWQSTASQTTTGRPVDAVLLPVIPSAAVIPGKLFHCAYITLANVIDHATMVVPVTRADGRVDGFEKGYVPVGEVDRKNWEAYDPAVYDSAPAAVQILGGRLEEERLLDIGQVVVDALRTHGAGATGRL